MMSNLGEITNLIIPTVIITVSTVCGCKNLELKNHKSYIFFPHKHTRPRAPTNWSPDGWFVAFFSACAHLWGRIHVRNILCKVGAVARFFALDLQPFLSIAQPNQRYVLRRKER